VEILKMIELAEAQVATENIPERSAVEATLNYLADASERPVLYTYDPPPGVPRMSGSFESRPVLIHNGRLEESSLDQQGFQLVRQETAVHDFYDREEIEQVYYPEVEAPVEGSYRCGEGNSLRSPGTQY
jgi:hypothetical protein